MQTAAPVLNAIYPLAVAIAGGTEVTLTGDLWDHNALQVLVGTTPATITAATTTSITFRAPANFGGGALPCLRCPPVRL